MAATRADASSFSSSSNGGLSPHRPVSAELAKIDQEDEEIGRVLIAIVSLPIPYIFSDTRAVQKVLSFPGNRRVVLTGTEHARCLFRTVPIVEEFSFQTS